jgi:hypothetical protein
MYLPQFDGQPQSVHNRIRELDLPIAFWHYVYKQVPLLGNLDTINELIEQGYVQVDGETDAERGQHVINLFSQLHDVVYVQDGDKFTTWTPSHSLQFVKKYPVTLCFHNDIEQLQSAEHIQILQFLPLPRNGEFAIIKDGAEAAIYAFHDLDRQEKKLKEQIKQSILDLAGDSKWAVFNEAHEICASELEYLSIRSDLLTDAINGRSNVRKQAKDLLAKLEQAHTDVVALRQSWLRPDWLVQWQEVRRMTQELAANYYEHHRRSIIPQSPYLFDLGDQIDKKTKRTRPAAQHKIDEKGYAPIVSSLPMQAVINSINNATSGADRWVFDEGKDRPPYYVYQREAGTTIVSYNNQPENTFPDNRIAQRLWNEVKSFDEQANDVILDIFSHLSRNLSEDGAAWFFASNHLDNRSIEPRWQKDTPGGKKRRAGYRKEDMRPINETLWRLENIWLTINQNIVEETETKQGKKRRKTVRYTHTGRFLTVDEKWYQNEITDEESLEPFPSNSFAIGWHIRPGEWLRTFLETPNRQVSQLCQTLLSYDPYRQKWAKRIGRYIMFHGHMQSKGRGGALTREIQKVLTEVSLMPDKNDRNAYARSRERFEQAMNLLTEDHVINGWKYADTFKLPHGHKLEEWLRQNVVIYIAPVKAQIDTPDDQSTQD